MGFWIFMLFMNLMIGLTMLGFGRYFVKGSPDKINGVIGYRTSMSMKNQDTWRFAHNYCGKLWLKIGWAMISLTVIVMPFLIGRDIDVIGTFGAILCGIQTACMVASIFPTEIALRQNFDKDGFRKI